MTQDYTKEQIAFLRANVDILRQTPIYEILLAEGKDVRHTRSGLYHSPFREDTHPSFHVDEVNHRFSDPGDFDPTHKKEGAKQAGGDTIDLVMWLKGLSYNDALIYLYELNPSIQITSPTRTDAGNKQTSTVLSGYTLLSGGAKGADTEWGAMGAQYGVRVRHFYHGRKTPTGNEVISRELFEEGVERVRTANLSLHRKIEGQPDWMWDLIARDWAQVKYADCIYAVSSLDENGRLIFRNGTGYTPVKGGTGWAVQMAMDTGKPVYLFDQTTLTWLRYTGPDENRFGWTPLDRAPVLTENFAGIGSRELTEAGKQAIKDAYYATMKNRLRQNNGIPAGVDSNNPLVITDNGNSADQLSMLAERPFVLGVNRFRSVEQWIQYNKAVTFGNTEAAKEILEAKSSFHARLLGKRVTAEDLAVLQSWKESMPTIMETGTRLSFVSNPQASETLSLSGNRQLTPEDESAPYMRLYAEILMKVRTAFQSQILDEQGEYKSISSIEICNIRQGISSPTLLHYETEIRCIDPQVLNRYCSQIDYRITFRTAQGEKKMTFMAVGFPNRSGEWTLRGAPYKTSDGAQKDGVKRSTGNDITIIDRNGEFNNVGQDQFAPSSESLVIFEGFNDFMSWLTMRGTCTPSNCDVIVLNSVVNTERAEPVIAQYKKVYTYLDADDSGRRATKSISDAVTGKGIEFRDSTYFFEKKGCKDFNEMWIAEAGKRLSRGEDIRIRTDAVKDTPVQQSTSQGIKKF